MFASLLRHLCWLALVGIGASGCRCGPCIPPGEYELFARRVSVAPGEDGGTSQCPEELRASLSISSPSTAHFVLDGGLEGDCALTYIDYRPKYECQASIKCTSTSADPRVSFGTFSFTRPEYEFIDGFSGVGDNRPGMSFRWRDVLDGGCDATYAYAAAARGRP